MPLGANAGTALHPNASQVFKWRRLFREPERAVGAGRFVPVVVKRTPRHEAGAAAFPPKEDSSAEASPAAARMGIVLSRDRRMIVDRATVQSTPRHWRGRSRFWSGDDGGQQVPSGLEWSGDCFRMIHNRSPVLYPASRPEKKNASKWLIYHNLSAWSVSSRISSSMRSAILCAGPRSCAMVQSAA